MEQNRSATLLIAVLFFIFGFVTWVNSTLIPYLKIACELNNFQSYFVTFAFYISYFVTALPSSYILNKTGLKSGMMLGLFIMALGTILFIPAAYTRNFYLFLSGLFITGTGLSILQTASNPYLTVVGPSESAAVRISIMGIFNKVAGVLAPIILGSIILSDTDALQEELKVMNSEGRALILNELALKVRTPYIILTICLILLGIGVRLSPLPSITLNRTDKPENEIPKSIFNYPYFWFGAFSLFLYVGAEVIAADTIGSYGNSLKIPLQESRYFPSLTLGAMVIGYLLGIVFIPKYISQSKALLISALSGIVLGFTAVLTDGYYSVISIALLGISNALMWPAIWPLSIRDLGKHTTTGSAILIMGISGGAILPLAYGFLSDQPQIGSKLAYSVLIPCYLFIAYFALLGHKSGLKGKG
jgi:glucose/galactose transporter